MKTDEITRIALLGQAVANVVNFLDPDKDHNPGDYQNTLDAWEVLSLDGLNPYRLDLDAANELLAADGWEWNEKTGIREKNQRNSTWER